MCLLTPPLSDLLHCVAYAHLFINLFFVYQRCKTAQYSQLLSIALFLSHSHNQGRRTEGEDSAKILHILKGLKMEEDVCMEECGDLVWGGGC